MLPILDVVRSLNKNKSQNAQWYIYDRSVGQWGRMVDGLPLLALDTMRSWEVGMGYLSVFV